MRSTTTQGDGVGQRVCVAGVGMIPFSKPGKSESYDVMGAAAARAALEDAGVEYASVQQAFVGYVYGDSTSGQAALYGLGQTGIPVVNVNNNCSTGSTALWMAHQTVAGGAADCVLALGFEQMQPGALKMWWDDRPSPIQRFEAVVDSVQPPDSSAPFAARYFGGAGAVYAERHGLAPDTFAKVAVKARRHAANNPYSVFREPVTLEEVLDSPTIYGPLTRLQCCPPTCGAAAAVVCTEEFARAHGLRHDVAIRAQAMTTDSPSTFLEEDMTKVVGYDMTRSAAQQVYERAGIGPEDVRVVELHDCFTTNEVLTYEALGLTPEGTAEKFIADGENTYGGRVVTNPSGGLLSKGHPLGATGLAQCTELVWQLRGQAAARQVEDVTVALQHNIGLGGAAVVTLYEKLG
jgi:sterol carrier protein 2